MPIYVFQCEECNKLFEQIMKATDTDIPKCEGCGNPETHKIITMHQSYSINGNNSASITPKRFRK